LILSAVLGAALGEGAGLFWAKRMSWDWPKLAMAPSAIIVKVNPNKIAVARACFIERFIKVL
jgi:hypothetical protein